MRILVIGGTRFVGKHFVEQAVARGHDVTLFHRGRTGMDLFPDLDHRIGDRDTDLSTLAEGEWDATVDTCAYLPRQVHTLADILGDRGGHHLLVSSVSVYAPPTGPGIDEDAALIELDDPTAEVVTAETYGGLKVLCERAAVERHGPSTLLVRPTYVVGPDDYTWRFPWWVQRIARGGTVVASVPGGAGHGSSGTVPPEVSAAVERCVAAGRRAGLNDDVLLELVRGQLRKELHGDTEAGTGPR